MNQDQLSLPSSSHAYGIGLIALIIGAAIGISYYQLYFVPEYNSIPPISEKVARPGDTTSILVVPGAANKDQEQNFVPKKIESQLGVNNRVIWTNNDNVAHYVTPDKPFKDRYSGDFGSKAIMPGDTYQFLFTEEVNLPYYCAVHPWMTGEIDVVHGALTS
jgi:plastocyanin